jgi:hypothetical protein
MLGKTIRKEQKIPGPEEIHYSLIKRKLNAKGADYFSLPEPLCRLIFL